MRVVKEEGVAITLSSHDAFVAALDRAQSIELGAYCLGPPMVRALDAAAARGARVRVHLEAQPYGGDRAERKAENAHVAADLRKHGVDVVRTDDGGASHLKAAIVDGVAWLDDRNFPAHGADTIVRDDNVPDVRAARRAIDGDGPNATGRLAFNKRDALELETRAIQQSAGPVDVSSEDFGSSGVSAALRSHLERGERVRIVVSRRDVRASPSALHALTTLQQLGAQIRVAGAVDKVAICKDRAWLGSANATFPFGATARNSEWGLVTHAPAGIAELRERFEAAWSRATPY